MKKLYGLALILGVVAPLTIAQGATLDDVKARGYVLCGTQARMPGFSQVDSKGKWSGMDVDACRAVSAAIFGDPDQVHYVDLTAKERFTALQSGTIDLLVRDTTWTMHRDTALGLNFTGTNVYDGLGFMVPKSLGLTSITQLDGASICIEAGTTHESAIADYFRAHNMTYEAVTYNRGEEAIRAMADGRCDTFAYEVGTGAALRMQLSNPENYVFLPGLISKEPLGPVVRQGDDQWFNIVKWTLFAMINAEELGVTSENVDSMMGSGNPAVARLLGEEGAYGEMLGLPNDWAVRVIKHVGNYAETFERNVGPDTPLGIARGLNALWSDGGILYAAPIR